MEWEARLAKRQTYRSSQAKNNWILPPPLHAYLAHSSALIQDAAFFTRRETASIKNLPFSVAGRFPFSQKAKEDKALFFNNTFDL